MDSNDSWTWPKRPTDATEFDQMMDSVDRHLARRDLTPPQRSLHAIRLISMALNLSGITFLGVGVVRGEPFSPSDLLPRVFDWYDETYGERNKIDLSLGYVVLPLRDTYWTLQIPFGCGVVEPFIDRSLANVGRQRGTRMHPATLNVLTCLRGITQAYAELLSNDELTHVMKAYSRGYVAMRTLGEMRGHQLFDQAKGDYRHSVEALSAGDALSKARWDNAQCAEKIFKGLLAQAGQEFPTSGRRGHDIAHLGRLISTTFGSSIPNGKLCDIHCPAAIRYGEINVDMHEAWTSHAALIDTLLHLRTIALTLRENTSQP